MASTVNQAFDEFNLNTVNLLKPTTDTARASRDWLIEQLLGFPENVDNFPNDYPERHIKYGSFARNTKVRPLDDIDLMYCLHAGNAYYSVDIYNPSKYHIHTPNATNELKLLSDYNHVLSSVRVVNKLVSALKNVPQYSNSETKRNQEAAVLNLTSYSWSYDIVPCFYTVNGFYLIPDGSGNWKSANPRIDIDNISQTNRAYGGKVYQLVRTLKYWNASFASPKIGSYLFEVLVLNYVKSAGQQSTHNDLNIREFFYYLSQAILYDVQDPKGIQGNINILNAEQRQRISNKAKECYDIAVSAVDYEVNRKDQQRAIEQWAKIFGANFPKYE